jgi:hypothetical protein
LRVLVQVARARLIVSGPLGGINRHGAVGQSINSAGEISVQYREAVTGFERALYLDFEGPFKARRPVDHSLENCRNVEALYLSHPHELAVHEAAAELGVLSKRLDGSGHDLRAFVTE